jgi:luciferase-type oxidoreductase
MGCSVTREPPRCCCQISHPGVVAAFLAVSRYHPATGSITLGVSIMIDATLPPDLAAHAAFTRVFRPGHLTLGFVMPLEAYPDSPLPTLVDHVDRARQADEAGFAALWLRDVPFLDPSFGDVGQILDPFAYAGFLAAITKHISIGTAGVVLPLRDPLLVAKQATSVDHLLGGRFLLGLSSGDRPSEYPAFGLDFRDRADRFRDAVDVIKVVTRESFPQHRSKHYGVLDGSIDLVPKAAAGRLPLVAIGRAAQNQDWLAANMDAWIWHGPDVSQLSAIVPQWRGLSPEAVFKPYGYGVMFELLEDPYAPLQPGRYLRAGRYALIDLLRRHQAEGVSHVMLNMKLSRRRAEPIMDELAEHILPLFPAG